MDIIREFGPEPETIKSTPLNWNEVAHLDAAIDRFIDGKNDKTAWRDLPPGAWRVFSEMVNNLTAQAIEAQKAKKTFMIAPPEVTDDDLWNFVLATEIRSPR
ncbi:hypothetical protein HK14_08945 [Acetobacter cibinongensis]|uniref:Uncharacterized protein n=2 Tax=Acetobacter cibinongensis TaxID=146475 RepID=A0A1Z5YTB6_9PROT|nr:hypothetical protein HK14_08945 [Acetobacter cibinongensis]